MPKFATVLVAGGNGGTLMPRKAALESAGFVVETAATGQDFVAKAESMRPSVALLEDTLPDMQAEELARHALGDTALAMPAMMLLESAETVVGPGFDDVLEPDADDSVLVARMQPLLRLATMRAELSRRRETARMFSGSTAVGRAATDRGEQKVLLVAGDGAVRNDLVAAIDRRIVVEREEDPFRAGDRLENERFDAAVVVLGAGELRERQLHLCGHIRSNPRMFDLPVLMIAPPDSFASASEPYGAGATVAMGMPFDAHTAAVITERLIRRQRQRWELRSGLMATLTADTADTIGCVYSAEFLREHLAGLQSLYDHNPRPLAIAVFTAGNVPAIEQRFGPEAARHLLRQIADFLIGLVRVEDLCARLSDRRFCIVMQETTARDAEIAVERIEAVLSHAEFHLTDEICEPVGVWIQSGVASLKSGDTIDSLIGRAIADTL